ncbi:MAG TPA: hypothetical protein VFN29_09050 [Chiayiivirga sp.]|nr:hypothetical protein [Chiayiivirga sp.]
MTRDRRATTACGSESYGWNQSGQLVAITDTTSNTTTAFQYDMLGNLRQVTMPDGHRMVAKAERGIDHLPQPGLE